MTGRRVLCVNAGSSSLKFALFALDPGAEHRLARGAVEGIGAPESHQWLERAGTPERVERSLRCADHDAAVREAFAALDTAGTPAPDAVGHRLVHGGPAYLTPTRVDEQVLRALRAAIPYAPLHLPAAIAGIEAVAARAPGVPQIACFDTGFHRALPEVAQRFALARDALADGVHRYGFHGLSYEYVVAHLGAAKLGRAVVAHLGQGASLAAIRDGRSMDTTMGFTPTGGVMMGTRSGDLDPGLLLHLLAHRGHDVASLERMVTREGGLLGVSGSTGDMRTLLERRAHDRDAALAVQMFCYQIRKAVGAFAAVLGGLDALVFTGGIGEHAAAVRAEVCDGLAHLGVAIDPATNAVGAEAIGAAGAPVAVRVVRTDEERVIARHVGRLLHGAPSRS